MKRLKVVLIFSLIISILMTIVGFFLYANLIPMQDIELCSKEELLAIQKECALNYPLGKTLLMIGRTGVIVSTALLIARTIYVNLVLKKRGMN